MMTGMGARKQPLMFIITTAGKNIEGPCYDKRRQVIEMLEGVTPDEELFGIIYTIDEKDDWTDPAVLAKANPNIGVSVYRDYLESQQRRAINNPRFTNTFKTKHLNVWVSAKSAFFNMESWRKCEDSTLSLEQFEDQECILGLDLARSWTSMRWPGCIAGKSTVSGTITAFLPGFGCRKTRFTTRTISVEPSDIRNS